MRRLVLALVVGVVCAAIAYGVTYKMAGADYESGSYSGPMGRGGSGGAGKFIFYMTALFGTVGFVITLGIQNNLAKKKWLRDRDVPQATVKKD